MVVLKSLLNSRRFPFEIDRTVVLCQWLEKGGCRYGCGCWPPAAGSCRSVQISADLVYCNSFIHPLIVYKCVFGQSNTLLKLRRPFSSSIHDRVGCESNTFIGPAGSHVFQAKVVLPPSIKHVMSGLRHAETQDDFSPKLPG